jgi:hypothetical protein
MKESKKPSQRELVLKQARISLRKGRWVVPVPAGRKGPVLDDWPELRLTEGELERSFVGDSNIGWITGAPSGDLVDIDLDCRAAVFLGRRFLPRTDRVHGREGRRTSHYWYISTPLLAPTKFTDVDGKCLAEIRADGQQTLIPPSIHPNRKRLEWEHTGEPARVSGEALHRALTKVTVGALLVRHYPEKGQRHDMANASAGMLLRAGWSDEDVAHFIEGVAEAAGDEESRRRVGNVVSTARKLAAGEPATGAPSLASIVGDDVVARLRQFLNLESTRHAHGVVSDDHDDWSEPGSLGDELPPVLNFDLKLLPDSLRPFVEDVSERMQTPPDYAATAAVVALAACVNRRAVIRPKLMDDSWSVVPNLWGVIVAPPGFMKSPVLRAATSPLNHIENLWRAQHENEVVEYEAAKVEAELRKSVWRDQSKQAMKKGEPIPIQPDDSLRPPAERRLVTTDSTFEKLHEILSENPAGVLVVRDELTGWLAGLDREGREGERGFFLQAWSGDMGYTMDRIGRGSIYVPAVCVSLLGNIQPARLRWYLGDALRGGANDDGLFQRFQVTVWPDPPKTWTLVDRAPNAKAMAAIERVYARLANLPADDPVHLRFGPEAQEFFFERWTELESKIRGDSGLSAAMIGHLSKYRSLMPSFAALFEMADRVSADEHLCDEDQVNFDHTRQAAGLCTYLESHAHRVYSCVASPECRAARELGRHIKRGALPPVFSTRSVYLKGWSSLDSPDKVRGALVVLEEAGWVRRSTQQFPIIGRPSESWLVNPKLKTAGER